MQEEVVWLFLLNHVFQLVFSMLSLCRKVLNSLLSVGPSNSVIVVGIYRPPSADPDAIDKSSEFISEYSSHEMITLGDFNLNWLTSESDYLKEACGNLNLTQLITDSTRPNLENVSKSTLIDLILSNRSDRIGASSVFDLGISDHCPIACIRDTRLQKAQSQVVSRRNFRKFTEQAFLHVFYHSDISTTLEIPDASLALDHFINTFNSEVNKHAPFKKQRMKDWSSPWFTSNLSSLS